MNGKSALKKINKSTPPNTLTVFATKHPQENWETFRNHHASADYKDIKKLLLIDQGGLCAYCETRIHDLPESQQRIEHYHPKSDLSNPAKNWALDWNNLLLVCLGGSDFDKTRHPLPRNLSCDAHKDHLITTGKLSKACENKCLNPLTLTTLDCLFNFDKSTGALTVNLAICHQLANADSQYQDLADLLNETIHILNLNCQRLLDDRLNILVYYNKIIAKARKNNDKKIFEKLAARWFSTQWPSFFTTRRILLGQHAERYLNKNNYGG